MGFKNLQAAVSGLTAEVELDITALQNVPTDAELQTLATAITTATSTLATARASITPAATT